MLQVHQSSSCQEDPDPLVHNFSMHQCSQCPPPPHTHPCQVMHHCGPRQCPTTEYPPLPTHTNSTPPPTPAAQPLSAQLQSIHPRPHTPPNSPPPRKLTTAGTRHVGTISLYQAGLLYSSMSTQSYGMPFSSSASHTCAGGSSSVSTCIWKQQHTRSIQYGST
jgi:hypothetical protein